MTERPRLRTVVVDDEPDVRYLLRRRLELSGAFEVVGEAGDGAAAIDLVRQQGPDVVIMDLSMPGVGGLAALPAVREVLPAHGSVVVISGQPSEDARRAVAEGRATAFIEKSVGYFGLVRDLLVVVGRADPADGVTWHLPEELGSCGVARRRLRELLAEWQLTDVLDEVELLTTELITNAILHARSAVDIAVRRRPGAVRVEVSDQGEGALEVAEADLGDTHGRGLLLVEAMARSWGTAMNGDTKTVWFEVGTDEVGTQ